jgi:multiple sugar transport system substrate-binding protein
MALRIALVGGPMYDHIESIFAPGEVEIVAKADHPTLNRAVAEMLAEGVRIDVLATHSKYAPSQIEWLHPLDDVESDGGINIDTSSLAPAAVELCRFERRQWCVPRLIDVRLLWSRADRVNAPSTWQALVRSSDVFGFTGRESGAFGMFFELVTGAGGSLFDEAQQPTMSTEIAIEALSLMAHLARRAPVELPDWHYDDVTDALLDGRVDMAAAWPGAWSAISASGLPLVPSIYPGGMARTVSYSGCHAWAIPRTCGDVAGATALLEKLCSRQAHAIDAAGGSICARIDALGATIPVSEVDQRRLALTRHTIANMMITYPPLRTFPLIENEGATAISAVLRRQLTAAQGAVAIQQSAENAVR